ncbi:MAG: FAD-dependent monooxygenase [Acetobacteraceae bacterium]|nr:FAD-dependent monooxygenase [Acetobacteraceae bacterium]
MPGAGLIGRSAVVIGAGMAGLTAARALADSFERVTVLERDTLPEAPAFRAGTPQARHVHVMLGGGVRALGELVPGWEPAMGAAGAARLLTARVRRELPGYDPFPPRDFGGRGFSASRTLIEHILRGEILRHPSIRMFGDCRVLRLLADDGRSSVAGVSYERAGGAVETQRTDLVVDASGRGTPTLAFLQASSGEVPAETVIGIDMGYATTTFDIPSDAGEDWDGVLHLPDAPRRARRALLMPIEGHRWLVGLAGHRDEKPPGDWDGYLEFARSLRTPTIYRAIRTARRAGPIVRFRFPASVRRHFDRLTRFPRGLLPVGDAICRFNPVMGQGMSVAAKQACVLRDLLTARSSAPDPLGGLAEAFFRDAEPIIDAPWEIAAIPDLVYPETEGERPPGFERSVAYATALRRLAAVDADVHRLTWEVQQLLRPASALRDPGLVERVTQLV